jgi:hypothetical protein
MKIVTVYDLYNKPNMFITTRFINVNLITDADVGGSDWDCVHISKFINLVFELTLEPTDGSKFPEKHLVCGNIEQFGDILNNGGKLPSTYHKFNELWNKEYFGK